MTNASDIEEQASLWLARRDAGRFVDDSREFAAWLAADSRHRAAYLRLAAAWERTARLKTLQPENQAVDPDLFRTNRPNIIAGPRWRRPLAFAASVALLGLAATWWTFGTRVDTYRTEIGGLSRVVLSDGSTVTLNTDTEVKVKIGKARREVALLRGEAQFAVAHDRSRPFEVSAGSRLVRAVGTAFDVRLEPGDDLKVIVTEGRVAFEDLHDATGPSETAASATISAGESASAAAGKLTVRQVSMSESSRRLAWQVGELSFQGETLAEAVTEFNRYNRRKLKVRDPAIGSLQIGGNFQALDVDSFVAALSRSFGISEKASDDGTRLLVRAENPAPDK